MSYETHLEGVLAIEPSPSEAAADELRRMLASWRSSDVRSSAWELTPMGHGLVNESLHGWEVQARHLRKIAVKFMRPRALHLVGRLEAIGEDETRLGAIVASASGVVVEREPEEDPWEDAAGWVQVLASSDAAQRLAGAEMLRGCEATTAVPALARAVSDDSPDVRRAALESLGAHGESCASFAAVIAGALQDSDPVVRYWATYALGRIGPKAAAFLRRLDEVARSDGAGGPRWGAVDAMKRIRG